MTIANAFKKGLFAVQDQGNDRAKTGPPVRLVFQLLEELIDILIE